MIKARMAIDTNIFRDRIRALFEDLKLAKRANLYLIGIKFRVRSKAVFNPEAKPVLEQTPARQSI
jgi:hypothetical protein